MNNIGIKSKHKAHDSYKLKAFRKNNYTYAHLLVHTKQTWL